MVNDNDYDIRKVWMDLKKLPTFFTAVECIVTKHDYDDIDREIHLGVYNKTTSIESSTVTTFSIPSFIIIMNTNCQCGWNFTTVNSIYLQILFVPIISRYFILHRYWFYIFTLKWNTTNITWNVLRYLIMYQLQLQMQCFRNNIA